MNINKPGLPDSRLAPERLLRMLAFFFVLLFPLQGTQGQYFGKNKVNYEVFPFRIYKTPHFQIYHYLDNMEKIEDFGQLAERWYERHQAIFLDTLEEHSPIIVYKNHADFQQTTVISSLIGVGTGGVTEGMRNRVVMPFMKSNAETNHVLGHELVHVFQYNMFKNLDTINLESINNIPLWMIEGLAEYMSVGTRDPHTAMWMRDAIMSDDIPTIKEMTRRPDLYFPYRYGHAFWSFITSQWGDRMIKKLLLGTAVYGVERAIDSVFGVAADTLSVQWKEYLVETHQPHIKQREDLHIGEKLFDSPRAINISPSISPDGKYIIFLADRDVITIDYYLADVTKKKIIRRLSREIRDTHIDNYSFLESVGSWSPDSKKYMLSMFSKGKKRLMIFGINENDQRKIIDIKELDYFENPAWSPDGKSVLLSGLREGQSDIYVFELENEKLHQLTDDYYSDQQPSWSPDGEKVVFISDRSVITDLDRIRFGKYKLCEYDMQSGSLKTFSILTGADIYSPQYSPDGEKIYFISTATGVKNLYEFHKGDETLYQLSDFKTGMSSISQQSPALSVARNSGQMAYVLYQNKGYSIFKADANDFRREQVNPYYTDLSAADLIPDAPAYQEATIVDKNLQRYPVEDPEDFKINPYKPEFTLEAISSGGVGVGISHSSAAAAGGVNFLFSDMLKRNQLFVSARVNGRIIDAGGQIVYMRQKNRLNWGISLSHIPYRSARSFYQTEVIDSMPVTTLTFLEQRMFEDKIGLFGILPFSKKIRLEAGLSAGVYSFRLDSTNHYYAYPSGFYLGESSTQLSAPDPEMLYSGYIAYVGDNANYGFTSPMRGYRYRFELNRNHGWINHWGITADYRRYFFRKPVGFAFRATHFGRYGKDANDLYPLFLGYPYYVRGYSYNSMVNNRCENNNCLGVNQITGSKMVLAGFEARLPLTGVKRLALIKLNYVYSDLVAFFDAGLAWHELGNIDFSFDPKGEKQIPIYSAGIALRINLFGAIILEPYYAFPLQKKDVSWGQLGFSISGGGW